MDIAHFRIVKEKKIIYQNIETHLNGTADLAESFAAKIKMPRPGDCWDYYMTAGNMVTDTRITSWNAYSMNSETEKRPRLKEA